MFKSTNVTTFVTFVTVTKWLQKVSHSLACYDTSSCVSHETLMASEVVTKVTPKNEGILNTVKGLKESENFKNILNITVEWML